MFGVSNMIKSLTIAIRWSIHCRLLQFIIVLNLQICCSS
jgi:hypothetical protein